MRIALLAPYPAPAGGETHAAAILRRETALAALLREFGHTVDAFRTTRNVRATIVSVANEPGWNFHPIDSPNDSPASEVSSRSLIKAVEATSPEFVLLKGAGTKLERDLLDVYGGPYGVIIGGGYRTHSLARADVVLTESREQRKYLARRLGSRRLVHLSKYVGEEFFDLSRVAEPEIDVLTVGRLERHKNPEALIPLFDSPLRIAIVGEGSLHARLQAAAKGRRATVMLPGQVSRAEVVRLMHSSKVLVHPSLSEGFPRAVAEAMAAGLPTVCLAGVVGEPVVHDVNGVLVRDENRLPAATLALINDPPRREKLGRAGCMVAQQAFSLTALRRCVAELEQHLDTATRRGPVRRNTVGSRLRQTAWKGTTQAAGTGRRLLLKEGGAPH